MPLISSLLFVSVVRLYIWCSLALVCHWSWEREKERFECVTRKVFVQCIHIDRIFLHKFFHFPYSKHFFFAIPLQRGMSVWFFLMLWTISLTKALDREAKYHRFHFIYLLLLVLFFFLVLLFFPSFFSLYFVFDYFYLTLFCCYASSFLWLVLDVFHLNERNKKPLPSVEKKNCNVWINNSHTHKKKSFVTENDKIEKKKIITSKEQQQNTREKKIATTDRRDWAV